MENNLKSRTPLLANLLSIYNTYVSYGYPKDPTVYTLRASEATLASVARYFYEGAFIPSVVVDRISNTITIGDTAGFKIEVSPHLMEGEIEFGPETECFTWKGV